MILVYYANMRKPLKNQGGFQMAEKPKAKQRTTGIEWTEHTWNPFIGCSIRSAGCQNCYAMNLAARLEAMGQEAYSGLTKKVNGKTVWTGKMRFKGKEGLQKPLKTSAPSIFFVNSMSDFFHDSVQLDWQAQVYEVMQECKRHQFQILTKRPENIQKFLKGAGIKNVAENVWIGATVEDARVAQRIAFVQRVPAKIRFLSIEPLVAPFGKQSLKDIEWVITGGESGHGARVMKVDWLREVRDLCLKYEVPHFFKQYGKASNNPLFWVKENGQYVPRENAASYVAEKDPHGKGGSKLDGRYWKEMPMGFKVAKA
jgi:protein gp37